MTEFRPHAELEGSVLHVQILGADPVRSLDVRCVVDLTDFGEVVGVEVLDLRTQLEGGAIAPPRSTGEISWSYDADIDALYIHVAHGAGQVQQSALARTQLDSAGRVVDMSIPVPRAT